MWRWQQQKQQQWRQWMPCNETPEGPNARAAAVVVVVAAAAVDTAAEVEGEIAVESDDSGQ
jgi:hypothetical protein